MDISDGSAWTDPNHSSSLRIPSLHQQPPDYGLLTRTLIHSPVVKKILPARIRRADLYDVVFIGETFLELHLLTESGKLQKVASKTDFRAEIRDARVFGSQRESNLSGIPRDDSMNGIHQEDRKLSLPPDVLVLTMDSGNLAFVYAREVVETGEVEFVINMIRISGKGLNPKYLGKAMTVDPFSRAMATTAYQDTFRIFALHSMEEVHRQMSEGLPLNPIKEERTIEVKGCFVVHMEFLYPNAMDTDHVLLVLFLIDANRKSKLQLYEWSPSKSLLDDHDMVNHGLKLSEDISIPIHIIPLVIHSAFLIVTEFYTHVVKASDIMDGNAKFHKVAIYSGPTRGQKQPLVTAYSRPYRHPQYSGNHDDMYLAMENGDIYYMEVEASGLGNLVQATSKASFLECSIGSAFAVLDNGLGKDDMIVAGGEMSSGGIYLVNISAYAVDTGAKQEESVTNWAPVFDFSLIDVSKSGMTPRDRVFAITGRGDHGAVTELRHGIQATSKEVREFLSGVRQLWILPDGSGEGYFVLAGLAQESFMCYRSGNGRDMPGDWWDCQSLKALELEEPTLAAGGVDLPGSAAVNGQKTVQPWTIQITPSVITLCQLSFEDFRDIEDGMDTDVKPPKRMQQRCEDGESIISAALYRNFTLITQRNSTGVKLVLAEIKLQQGSDQFLTPIGASVDLGDDPTFVGFGEFQNQPVAMIGTRTATIQILQCSTTEGLLPVSEMPLYHHCDSSENGIHFCESAIIISSDKASKLLCGLRGGSVVDFSLDSAGPGDLKLTLNREIHFGPIPVQLYNDTRRKDVAFALAGPEVYRFEMPRGKFKAAQLVFVVKDLEVDPTIHALTQAPDSSSLICVTEDKIVVADIGDTPSGKICGRKIMLKQTPRRMLYHEPLGVFVVATSYTVGSSDSFSEERKSYCGLKIIHPESGESLLREDPIQGIVCCKSKKPIFGTPGEQIYCITEWHFKSTVNENEYRYIAIGTGTIVPGQPPSGRGIILTLKQDTDGKIDIRKQFQWKESEPVYSLAPFGSNGILYCSGKTLKLRTLNEQTLRMEDAASTRLRSPAAHISVTSNNLIHLSCAADSLLVAAYENGELKKVFSDSVARAGFHHIKALPNLVLATDKQYGLTGHWHFPAPPSDTNALRSTKTIFDAELTSSISRVRRGMCRPPWIDNQKKIPGVVTIPEGLEQDEYTGITGKGDNLIAAGVDGSFFQLTILTKEAVELLRFLQRLFAVEQKGGKYAPLSKFEDTDLRGRHVDGDFLAQVVKLGPEWLKMAVEKRETAGRWNGIERGELMGFNGMVERVLGKMDWDEGLRVYENVVAYVDELVNDAVL